LDADKEGFLRSDTSLVQTIGRAARHVNGRVLMYADVVTRSMQRAIDETSRRREVQMAFNTEHDITPVSIVKGLSDLTDRVAEESGDERSTVIDEAAIREQLGFVRIDQMSRLEMAQAIKDLESRMRLAADSLDFEKAAVFRDEVSRMRKELSSLNV
ncbi:MAG TPA: excinuclease ABC subunit B, partial [Chloroflexi bacterium]|nr:excinuclease ABC subunit B [Chloroflexota bacterium]